MLRFALWIALAGCSSPKRAQEPVWPPDEPACAVFDPSNEACETKCLRTAPEGWPACEDATDALIALDYICQGRKPFTCQPSPRSLKAPIQAWDTIEGAGEITIGAGMSKGVTLDWTALLIDAHHQPLDGSFITLTVVNDNDTRGSVFVLPELMPTAVGVLLQPAAPHDIIVE